MRLSVCIPTHQGRLTVLKSAIDSVLDQITSDLKGEVEICVSDNASEDGTREALENYCRKYPDQIVYHRNSTNQGFPFNVLNVIQMAHGEYCWFLGSDDQIAAGGVNLVLEALKKHPDVTGITVNRTTYDVHLYNEVEQDAWYLLPDDPEQSHVYDKAHDVFANCGVMHTYMSAQVFRREAWLEVVEQKGEAKFQYHSYYPHLYGISAMIVNHPKWMWLPERIVKYRTGNDASLQHQRNRWHTHVIVVMDGLVKVWSEILGKGSSIYNIVMYKYFLFSWHPQGVLWLKSFYNYTSWDDLSMTYHYTKRLYFLRVFWLRTLPALLVPHFIVKLNYGHRFPLVLRACHSLRYRTSLLFRKLSGEAKRSEKLASAARE